MHFQGYKRVIVGVLSSAVIIGEPEN